MKYLFILLLLITGCANQPEKVTFATVAAQNESLKQPYPKRIEVDLQADCDDSTHICEISEANLESLVNIINGLQDEVEKRIDSYNSMIPAISHCEYANAEKDRAISMLETAREREQLIGIVKGVLYLGLCGAGLIYGN